MDMTNRPTVLTRNTVRFRFRGTFQECRLTIRSDSGERPIHQGPRDYPVKTSWTSPR